MGISLQGVQAWTPNDQIAPGSYILKAGKVERDTSSGGHPQVKIEWAVAKGEYTGAEQRDWITFSQGALGNIAMVLAAASIPSPTEDFEDFEKMADWFAGAIVGAVVEGIVRLEPSRKDPEKEFPTIKGYRAPSSSDVPSEGFEARPAVKDQALPF